jgi:hypothetical protein
VGGTEKYDRNWKRIEGSVSFSGGINWIINMTKFFPFKIYYQ